MIIIVPSYVRVGSTWVCRMASSLLEAEKEYVHLKCPDGIDFNNLPELKDNTVYKTHDATPSEFLPLVCKSPDTLVIVVKRNFMDAFVSKYFYEKNNRGTEKLPRSPIYHELFERYPNIPDDAGLNLLVEGKREFIRQDIARWYALSKAVQHVNYLVVDYDKCVGSNDGYLLDLLTSRISSTPESRQKAYEHCSLSKMKQAYQKDFVRKGKSGEWRQYLDEQSINFLEQEIQKAYNNL